MTVFPFLSIPVAAAVPPPQGGARITGVEHVNDRWDKVSVYSPSMDKVIVNDVFKAPKTGSPTFYLLPGIDGGDNLDPGASFAPGTKSWFGMTDIQGFFANKNVNVVSPLGGQFSWYTDWINDSSKQYQTYTTRELPPLINAEYKANGKNAVGGLSSTGGTAIDYAIQAPGLYKAVGSYSGFPSVSDPDEAQQVSLTLSGGGASAENMWGPLGRPRVGGARPVEERREVEGRRGIRRRVRRRGGRRRPAAPRIAEFHRRAHRGHRRGQHQAIRRCRDGRRGTGQLRRSTRGLPHMGPLRVGDARVMEHHHRPGAGGIATTDIGPAAPCGHRFSMAVAWALLSKPRHR
jgi:hypothetical protein